MAIKKSRKHKLLAASALGLLGLAPKTASADVVNASAESDDASTETSSSSAASSASSQNVFSEVASNAHREFTSAVSSLDSEAVNTSDISSAVSSVDSSAVSSASSASSTVLNASSASSTSSTASNTSSSTSSSTSSAARAAVRKAARKASGRFTKTAALLGAASGNLSSLSNASSYSNYDRSSSLTDPETDKASYKKGENVPVKFAFANSTNKAQNITASLTVYHGATQVGNIKSITKSLGAGQAYDVAGQDQGIFTIDNGLLNNNSGYTIQIKVTDASGNVLGIKNFGLAIEDDWTNFPRYGVIAGSGNHAAGIPNDPALMKKYSDQIEEMKNMHVNSYFFYDVYKDAANPFPDEASYTQNWVTWTQNKPQISTQAVKDLVSKVHATGASAMLYNMIHAKNTYENQANTPGLPDDSQLAYNAEDGGFGKKGQIMTGTAASQEYYNPASPSWQAFITKVMIDAMKRGNFDGWNGDTIGDNIITTSENRNTNNTFHMQDTYGIFSKAVMDAFKGKNNGKDYYYTINNVNAGGIKDSMANESVVYAELWPEGNFAGHQTTEYGDLKNVVDYVRENSGKSPIISAYLKNNAIGADNTYSTNAELLTTATIAASGGYHMELNANANSNDPHGVGILGNEYYPNQDHKVSEDLNRLLYQYSQFQVQYENFLRGSDVVNDTALAKTYNANGDQISYDDNNKTSAGRMGNQVWTFTKKGNGFKTIQLINLMGINSDWDNTSRNNKKDPEVQTNLSVVYPLGSMSYDKAIEYAENVYVTSPDDWNKGNLTKVNAQVVDNHNGTYSLKIAIPQLSVWDVIYVQDPTSANAITYTTSTEHKTVNHTVNYVMSDGSKAPDSHHDSLTFTKTTTTGSLKSLIDRANRDGLTLHKDATQSHANKNEADSDLNAQIPEIKKILNDYEAKKAAYDIAKAVYDKAKKEWDDAQNSKNEHIVKGISQQMTFVNENNANVAFSSPSGSPVDYIKTSAWLGSDKKGIYNYDNVTKSFTDDQITHNAKEATMDDSNHDSGWGNTYTGIRMKVGQTVQSTYTNLTNSVYTDSNGAIHKIGSVKISYKLTQTTANDNTANVFLSNSPTITFWFTAAGDHKDRAVDFEVNVDFYDENGNKINLGKGSNAWLSMSSLNRSDATEYFAPGNNTAKEIPGSTVAPHSDGLWYSNVNNETADHSWDSTTAPNRYYGAAVMEYDGQPFHVGKKIGTAPFIYDWFALDTNLATAYEPKEPTVPNELLNKPSISYHDVEYSSWDDPKTFSNVESPNVTDYVPNRSVVNGQTINHTNTDITDTVTYTPNIQKATITYIDETTGKTLKTDSIKGISRSKSGYTTASQIKDYEDNGYALDTDDTNGQEIVFDDDASRDQSYTVKLKHTYITVTPENPQTPLAPINKNPTGVKYPEGVDKASLEDDVTRHITYVMSDGTTAPDGVSQTLHYTAYKTFDRVTGQITDSEWSDNQDFDDVDSPDVQGYTPDTETVVNEDIAHDHADINVTVRYTPDKQKATVTYIDDTTGNVLTTKDLEGGSNTKSGYTTKQSIDSYVASGYDLISDSTNGQEIVYDNDGDVDQEYTVHLKHRLIKPTDEQHVHRSVVTRKIDYVMSDNSPAPASRLLSLSFSGQDTIDAVTKETIKTDWTPAQNFDAVASPTAAGYTPDIKTVPGLTVSHDSANTTVTVHYTPDPQRATVTYIDDTSKKTLDTALLNGVSNAKSGYTTKSAIDAYGFIGYKLVSDDTNGAEIVYDHDDAVDQSYTVHLKRTYEQIPSPQKKYVHRTITYRMSDGSSAPIPVTQTLTFTGKDTVDSVTKQVISTVWSEDQTFAEVASPNVNGYTPDRSVVSAITVGHDHADINEVVTYVPRNATATVTYIDKTTGKTLKTDSLAGKAGTLTGYSTTRTIDGYKSQGYKLVSDQTGQSNVIMPASPVNYLVYLAHTTEDADPLTDTVTRTIHYVVEGGGMPAPETKTDTLTFTAKVVKDKVTGQTVSTTWSPNRNFDNVASPSITGYTPDKTLVSNYNISHDSPDITVLVTYKRDMPSVPVTPPIANTSITVNYIDDATGQTIKTDSKSGKPNTDSGYTTKSAIDYLEGKGYSLVSDQTGGRSIVFGNSDKTYAVHLGHGTESLANNKVVNRTINYVMSDGATPPNSVKDALTFRETIVKDKVTGAIIKSTWSSPQDFKDVASPVIKGYTVDRAIVSNKNIPYNHKDIIETVVYTPENQKGTITYVDQTTGTVLETNHIQGRSNAKSGYTTENSLKIWEAYGYELVKDETGDKEIIFDNDPNVDQNYTVTLRHGSKTENTSAVVKRTIDYVVKGGKAQAPASIHDSLTFKATVVIDKVTGKLINVTWSGPQDFKDVVSPVLTGYKVDRTLVSDKNIAHDHPSIHEVVTYTPDSQNVKVIYIDDTTRQTLKTDDLTGNSGMDSGYNTKSVIDGYLDSGYDLVSDDTKGQNVIFDSNSNLDQIYYVHVEHGTVTVDPNHPQTPLAPINKNPNGAKYPDGVDKKNLTKTVTRTVNYVMTDGSTPPASVKDAKTFNKTLVIDKVTGQILSSSWMASQTFDKVDSPLLDGYTPDKESVPSVAIDHTSSDITETVTYAPIIKKGSVVFVDVVTGKTLKTKDLEGKVGQKSGYTTAGDITQLEGQGYVLVQDDTNGQELLFDGQNHTVKLAHRIDHTLDYHEATRTVIFHLPTGSKTVKQVADVIRTVNVDAVTGQTTYGEWSKNNWPTLDVLTAEGFTPSLEKIDEEAVSGNAEDKTVDVYYTASAKDAEAEIPAKPETPSSVASSAASSASSAASLASSSASPSSALSAAPSSASSAISSAASSVAPSSVAPSVKAASPASAKTLPQTGADNLAAVMESVLGLASAIAGSEIFKKKHKKSDDN